MNNNDTPTMGPSVGPDPSMPQPASSPVAPASGQPLTAQPAPNQPPISGQPIPVQPTPQPFPRQTTQPIAGSPLAANGAGVGQNKNHNLIIGLIVGAIILVGLVVALLVVLLHSNGEKTVSCDSHQTMYGVSIDEATEIKARDGEMSNGKVDITVDLTTLSSYYRDHENEIVDNLIEGYKRECESHCSFNSDYVEGERVVITLDYDKEGVTDKLIYAYGIENMSAQEVADKAQETMERSSGTTCRQN